MNETKKELTTAELFATLVGTTQEHIDDDEVRCLTRGALSELERRMGAMERAAHDVLHTPSEDISQDQWAALDAALTDATPVFTLEEVVQLVHEAYIPWVSRDDVRESIQHHHAALRR